MNRIRLTLVVVLLGSMSCAAQICAHYPKTPVQTASGQTVPFPLVRVCAEPATGLTCTPLVSLFSDRACSQALPNPMTGDAQGNVDFYTAASRVHLQEKGFSINQIDVADVYVADPLQPVWTTLTQTCSSGNVVWDTAVATTFVTTLAGPCTSMLLHPVLGRIIYIRVVQDSVGGWMMTWPTNIATPCVGSLVANTQIQSMFWYDGSLWRHLTGCGEPEAVSVIPSSAPSGQFATGVTTGGVITYGAVSITAPTSAGASTTVSGQIVFDTTNKNYHFGGNGVDNIGLVVPSSVSITNGDCAKWSSGSGTITMADNGGPCPASIGAVGSNFLTSYNASTGAFTRAQPSYSDLSGTLPGSALPNPSSSTLGGVESFAPVANQFLTSISTSGVPAAAQPACGNLSNASASCSIDATNAANIASGLLALNRITPGSEGQCLMITGGVVVWDSCGGGGVIANIFVARTSSVCSTAATNSSCNNVLTITDITGTPHFMSTTTYATTCTWGSGNNQLFGPEVVTKTSNTVTVRLRSPQNTATATELDCIIVGT